MRSRCTGPPPRNWHNSCGGKYPGRHLIAYPVPTGGARKTSAPDTSTTDHTLLERADIKVYDRRAPCDIRDKVQILNWVIRYANGRRLQNELRNHVRDQLRMTLLWAALVAAVGAGGFGLARWQQGRRLRVLQGARSTTIAELQGLQSNVADQIGAGAFQEAVRLEGHLVCAEPLLAPWSGEVCVAFIDTVLHVFQERVETSSTDAKGRTSRSSHWEPREEQVSRLERRCCFGLRQGELELPVDPTGAELELETVLDTLDPEADAEPRRGGAITPGSASRVRSLGLRRREQVLLASGRIFLMAEASDAGGSLQLGRPVQGGLFLIRRNSMEELLRATRRWQRLWSVATGLLLALAIGLALAGLLR